MHYKVLMGTTSPRDLLMSTKLGGHFVRYKVLIDEFGLCGQKIVSGEW